MTLAEMSKRVSEICNITFEEFEINTHLYLDNDACFRLMCKYKLHVITSTYSVLVTRNGYTVTEQYVDHGSDVCLTTRIAVVKVLLESLQ